jgi:hypothetical protein
MIGALSNAYIFILWARCAHSIHISTEPSAISSLQLLGAPLSQVSRRLPSHATHLMHAKQFPGTQNTTFLSRSFSDQGVRVRKGKNSRKYLRYLVCYTSHCRKHTASQPFPHPLNQHPLLSQCPPSCEQMHPYDRQRNFNYHYAVPFYTGHQANVSQTNLVHCSHPHR